MPDAHTFICRCGTEFNGVVATPPPGWARIGDELLCTDCTAPLVAATKSDAAPRPTPIAGDLKCNSTSILLRSGVLLDLADPDCNRIQAIDIAAGLRQFRFSAQSPRPYTIAQHSLLVLRLVEPAARNLCADEARNLRRCALLHDAPEAFLHDITRPLKSILPDYRRIEADFETRFAQAFGLRWRLTVRRIVKRADLMALAIEKRELLRSYDHWPVDFSGEEHWQIANQTLDRFWAPDEAESRFFEAYLQLEREPERAAA